MADRKNSTTRRINVLSVELDIDIRAVAAIMDAAKVLTALERAKPATVDGLLTGGGYAAGDCLLNDTLPDLLRHGSDVARSMERKVEQLNQLALTGREPLREVANV